MELLELPLGSGHSLHPILSTEMHGPRVGYHRTLHLIKAGGGYTWYFGPPTLGGQEEEQEQGRGGMEKMDLHVCVSPPTPVHALHLPAKADTEEPYICTHVHILEAVYVTYLQYLTSSTFETPPTSLRQGPLRPLACTLSGIHCGMRTSFRVGISFLMKL